MPPQGPDRVVYTGYGADASASPAEPVVALYPDPRDPEQRLGLLDLRTGKGPQWFRPPARIEYLAWSYGGDLFGVGTNAKTGQPSVYRLGLDGSDAKQVWDTSGGTPPVVYPFSQRHPDWLLVLWSTAEQLAGGPRDQSLGVLDTSTGNVKVCATGRIGGPLAWSTPQGDLVAYTRVTGPPSAEGTGEPSASMPTGPVPDALCLVRLSDGSERVLARGTDQIALAFLGDSEIAYLTQDNTRAALRVVRTDGSGDHEVWSLAKPQVDTGPAEGPQGDAAPSPAGQ
ncbi:MAG: hypothetical protein ABFE16_09940 [Armatimonadia bacterium]